MRKNIFNVLMVLIFFPFSALYNQAWEVVQSENFATIFNYSDVNDFPGVQEFGFDKSSYGASGYPDSCVYANLVNSNFISFEAQLSDAYEYRVSWNLKAYQKNCNIGFYVSTGGLFGFGDDLIGTTLTIPQQDRTLAGQVYTSDIFTGYDSTYYVKLKVNTNSFFSGRLYADDFKLERRLLGGGTQTVSFKDSLLTVEEGGSVQVCLQLDAVADSILTTDVVLTNSSSPHLDNYVTQTLIFPSGSSSDQCFSLQTDPIDGTLDTNQVYILEIQNTNGVPIGSPSELQLTVTDQSPSSCYTTADTFNICSGENISIGCTPMGNTNLSYQWQPTTGFTNGTTADQADPTVQVSTTTTYTLNVTNSLDSIIAQKVVQVNVATNPNTVSIQPDPAIIPLGGNLDLTASVTGGGTVSYLWSTSATDSVINVSQSGTYGVTITNSTGCETTASLSVGIETAPPPPSSASSPNLGPGDLVFIAFDNNIGSGVDRVVLTNLVPLEPGTQFMLTNARYCADDDRWYKNTTNDLIAAQCVSYNGTSTLPVGSILCFDIPATGDYLITNFQVDGISSTDFSVTNCGHSNYPNISLQGTADGSHLFLLQGRWNIFDSYADFIGRGVHGLNVSNYWHTPGSGCLESRTQLPEDLLCIEAPDFPRNGSLYAYFDCASLGTQQSVYDFLKHITEVTNWEIEEGTSSLDLVGGGCSLNCTIVQDSLFWTNPPDTLLISCLDNVDTSIDNWLNTAYTGLIVSSCGGPVTVTNDYVGNLSQACTSEGLAVSFVAADTCGNYSSSLGIIQLSNTQIPIITNQPLDTIVNCTDLASLLTTLEDWKARQGGTLIGNSCGVAEWQTIEEEANSNCGVIDYIDIAFQATTICGDTLLTNTVRFDVQDNQAPAFSAPPQAKTLDCNDPSYPYLLKRWLNSAGEATVEDNCSTVTLSYNIDPLSSLCGTIPVTFTITDACGNSSLAIANLTVTDNVSPTFTQLPDTAYISVQDTNFQNTIDSFLIASHGGARVSDVCTKEEDIIWSHNYNNELSQSSCDTTTITLFATDLCDNVASTQLVLIARDDTAPIITGNPQDLSLSCEDATFSTKVDSLIELHNGLVIIDPINKGQTWSYGIPKAIVPHCGEYPISYEVTDGCGNSSTYETTFEVTDNIPPIFDTLAQDLYIPYDDSLKYYYLFEWLDNHGGARAEDNCATELIWNYSPENWNIPDTSCWEAAVSFQVTDGCNISTTTASFVLYQPGIDTIQEGGDLGLTCCATDVDDINDWLDNQAGAEYLSVCGQSLTWSYSGYDPLNINICQDQTITFTGLTPYGESITFSQSLVFTDSLCCNGASVSLSLINISGQNKVKATPSNCSSPIYTWRKDGQLLPQYSGIDEVPYDSLGAGQYEVEVNCNGEPCSVQTTAVYCDGFEVGLACEEGVLYPDSISNCSGVLNPVWYRDGVEVARDTDFYAIPDFGTYTMYASCNDHCVDSASISLTCADITLSLVRTGNQIEALIPACYPYNPVVVWTINGKEIDSYSGLLNVPYLGNGTYGVTISFPGNCTKTISEYYCDSFTVNVVNNVSHLTANPIGCFTPHYQWFKLGQTNPVAFNTAEFTPSEAGNYRVDVSCGAACSATSTYVYWEPCTTVTLSGSSSNICASLSGTYCNGYTKNYTWYLEGVEIAQTTNSCFTPTQIGNYTVKVDCGPCAATSNSFYISTAVCQTSIYIGNVGNSYLIANLSGTGCEGLTQTYTWKRDGVTVQQSSNATYYPSQSGNYTVMVECGDAPAIVCEAQSASVSFTADNCDITADIQRDGDQLCAYVGGNDCQGQTETYTWRRYGVVVASGTSGNCYTPTLEGPYTVEVSCVNGSTSCATISTSYYFTIDNPCDISISITESDDILYANLTGSSCNGVTAIYTWYKDGVNIYEGPATFLRPKEGGIYTVEVSCGNNPNNQCTASSGIYSYTHFCDGRSITIDTSACTTQDPNCVIATISTNGFCAASEFEWESLDTSAVIYKQFGINSDAALITAAGCYQVSTMDICADYTCDVSTIVCFGGSARIAPNTLPGVNNEITISGLHLFPNPTKEEVFLQLNATVTQKAQLEIFDISGNRISRKELELVKGFNQFKHPTLSLPTGIYLVRLSVKNGLLQKRLVIVE